MKRSIIGIFILLLCLSMLASCKDETDGSQSATSETSAAESNESPDIDVLEEFKNLTIVDMVDSHAHANQKITVTIEEVGRKETYTFEVKLMNENYKHLDVRKRKMVVNLTGPNISQSKTVVFVNDRIYVENNGEKFYSLGNFEMFNQYTGFDDLLFIKEDFSDDVISAVVKTKTDEYCELLLEEDSDDEGALEFFSLFGMTNVDILTQEHEYLARVENNELRKLNFNYNMTAKIDGVEKNASVEAVFEIGPSESYQIIEPKRFEYKEYPTVYANEILVGCLNEFIMSSFKSFEYFEGLELRYYPDELSDSVSLSEYIEHNVKMICPNNMLKFSVDHITGEFTRDPYLNYDGKTLTTYENGIDKEKNISQQEAMLIMNNYNATASSVMQLGSLTYISNNFEYTFDIEESTAKTLVENALQLFYQDREYGEIELSGIPHINVKALEHLGIIEYLIYFKYEHEGIEYNGEYKIVLHKIEYLDQNSQELDI